MGRLEGAVAFITGAGSGIGRATAHNFAAEGAAVAIADIDSTSGQQTADGVSADGGRALYVGTDVTDENSVATALDHTEREFGPITTVVNCAGGSLPTDAPAPDVDLSVWDHTIGLDLKGTFLVCRLAIPRIVAAGGGSVINLSSITGIKGSFPMHVYSTAKGGILSLTRTLAGTYATDGVRVNAICPAAVLTDRARERMGPDGPKGSGIDTDTHPFAVGRPEDVANIALFLASDESRMITGAVIPADGGLTAY